MFVAPHPPYEIPEPWFSMIPDASLPENVGQWCEGQSPLQLYNLTGALGARYTREDWQRIWPVYLGLVALLDRAVGMILDELERQGIYEDSLILFLADHGEMLGSHCLFQKMCMYEESVLTPFCFKPAAGMGIESGTSELPVSAVDVLPTICELAGVAPPAAIAGRSLVPAMGGAPLDREAIYIQFDGNGARGNFQRAVVRGNQKLIVDIFKDETYLELYDVVGDPQETQNLAFETARGPQVEEMLGLLRRHMRETGDLLSLPEDVYRRFLADYGQVRGARSV
jgi:arylsulfatase A-like enzyme